jgi:hypothetical protein
MGLGELIRYEPEVPWFLLHDRKLSRLQMIKAAFYPDFGSY